MSGGRHDEEEVRRGGKYGDRQENPFIQTISWLI